MLQKSKVMLSYLFDNNKIPVWIFSKDKRLLFSSSVSTDLRAESELLKFFEYFIMRATNQPSIFLVSEVEIFASFRFDLEGGGEENTLIAGPIFNFHPAQSGYKKYISLDYLYRKESAQFRILETPTMSIDRFCGFVQVLTAYFLDAFVEIEWLTANCLKNIMLDSVLDKELTKAIFDIREEEAVSVYSMTREQTIMSAIRRGDIELIKKKNLLLPAAAVRAPIATRTKNQFEYEVVSLIALSTRAAVEGGLDVDTAFSLSDLYLHRIDNHRTANELSEIARHALLTFTEKVWEKKRQALNVYPGKIRRCIEYIQSHLHYQISLEEVAEAVKLNPKYLSRYFLETVGVKFVDFIRAERIKEACELLKNTDMSCIDIGNSLSFSSQSYFIKVFTEVTGVSPQVYKKQEQEKKQGT